VQCSAVQCSAVQCSAVQCSAAQVQVQCRCRTVGVTGTSNQSGTACMLLAPADASQGSCSIWESCTCMQWDHASQQSTPMQNVCCDAWPATRHIIGRCWLGHHEAEHGSVQQNMARCITTTTTMQPSCIGPCQHEAMPGGQQARTASCLQHVQPIKPPRARYLKLVYRTYR
jgi:hypothetical protein